MQKDIYRALYSKDPINFQQGVWAIVFHYSAICHIALFDVPAWIYSYFRSEIEFYEKISCVFWKEVKENGGPKHIISNGLANNHTHLPFSDLGSLEVLVWFSVRWKNNYINDDSVPCRERLYSDVRLTVTVGYLAVAPLISRQTCAYLSSMKMLSTIKRNFHLQLIATGMCCCTNHFSVIVEPNLTF